MDSLLTAPTSTATSTTVPRKTLPYKNLSGPFQIKHFNSERQYSHTYYHRKYSHKITHQSESILCLLPRYVLLWFFFPSLTWSFSFSFSFSRSPRLKNTSRPLTLRSLLSLSRFAPSRRFGNITSESEQSCKIKMERCTTNITCHWFKMWHGSSDHRHTLQNHATTPQRLGWLHGKDYYGRTKTCIGFIRFARRLYRYWR